MIAVLAFVKLVGGFASVLPLVVYVAVVAFAVGVVTGAHELWYWRAAIVLVGVLALLAGAAAEVYKATKLF